MIFMRLSDFLNGSIMYYGSIMCHQTRPSRDFEHCGCGYARLGHGRADPATWVVRGEYSPQIFYLPPKNFYRIIIIENNIKYLVYTFFALSSAVLYCISKALIKIHSQKLSCCGRRGIPLSMAYPPQTKNPI